jgi:hypothetical protein
MWRWARASVWIGGIVDSFGDDPDPRGSPWRSSSTSLAACSGSAIERTPEPFGGPAFISRG